MRLQYLLTPQPFRQDAHFIYLTGAHDMPDCSLVVAARSKSDFTSTLFIADVDPDSVMCARRLLD